MNINTRFGMSIDTPHDEKYWTVVNTIGLNKIKPSKMPVWST